MTSLYGLVENLKQSIEEHSVLLKQGRIFLPEFLKGKEFSSNVFPRVMDSLAHRLGVSLRHEYSNKFIQDYEIGNPQRVDYAFMGTHKEPTLFFELESLGRSQLYLFTDAEFKRKNNDNKLWYYYGTLGTHYTGRKPVPRYFIFFLTLPDRQVNRYQLWDIHKEYQIFHPNLSQVVFSNPYRFYDYQIKAQARAFLQRERDFLNDENDWVEIDLENIHEVCELAFITCTIDELILSRGKNLFDPKKDEHFPIQWKKSRPNK